MQLAAVALDQADAVLLDREQVAMAGDEGDVLAGERQARPEQAADRAGTDDGDLHAPMLPSPGLALRRAGP